MKNKSKLSILILVFLVMSVFYPLFEMLRRVEWASFGTLISSAAFKESLFNYFFLKGNIGS